MSGRTFWTSMAVMGVIAVVALLAFGLGAKGTGSIAVGDPAPDKPLPVLAPAGEDPAGRAGKAEPDAGTDAGDPTELRLADFRGDWVLVNFWASWCTPCRTEAPAIEAFYRANRRHGFEVFGINSEDLTGDALEFADEFDLTYPLVRDATGERRDAFGMLGYPESFLVDPKGRIALIRRGPVDTAYLEEFVKPLIRGTRSS